VYGLDFQREAIRGTAAARERLQRAYYFEYQGRIDDRFFFSAGGRYDDNADFGGHTSARLSAAYVQPLASGAAIKYRTSVGTGFRAPSLYELAYNRGPFAFPPAAGLDLTEESTAGFDVGIDFTGPGGTTAEATYFDQRIEDEIYFDAAGYSGYLQSPGRSRSHGVELALSVPIARSWNFLGNFTYDRTEDQAGRPRIRRPKQLGNLGFRFLPEAGKLKLMANYRFSRDAVDEVFGVGRVPLDDYAVLDVSGAYALSPLLEIYGRIENLTDQDYEEVIGFNTPGRSAWAGVRLRF
jgi:vitamin B12 transporter